MSSQEEFDKKLKCCWHFGLIGWLNFLLITLFILDNNINYFKYLKELFSYDFWGFSFLGFMNGFIPSFVIPILWWVCIYLEIINKMNKTATYIFVVILGALTWLIASYIIAYITGVEFYKEAMITGIITSLIGYYLLLREKVSE